MINFFWMSRTPRLVERQNTRYTYLPDQCPGTRASELVNGFSTRVEKTTYALTLYDFHLAWLSSPSSSKRDRPPIQMLQCPIEAKQSLRGSALHLYTTAPRTSAILSVTRPNIRPSFLDQVPSRSVVRLRTLTTTSPASQSTLSSASP